MILGIDEVGRGAWAGPLVVGACVLANAEISGLTDSKKITKKQREKLAEEIKKSSAIIGFGEVSSDKIDEIGLGQSLRLAAYQAVRSVQKQCREEGVKFDQIIIDGTVNFLEGTPLDKYVSTMKKADLLIASVSAAAISAKVYRDGIMKDFSKNPEFSMYGFETHSGYGTKKHQESLIEFGVSSIHRKSFRPVAKIKSEKVFQETDFYISDKKHLSTKNIGDLAEQKVADLLEKRRHQILARNWRTRWCEIDIVSKKDEILYFTEVKFRKNSDFGGGISALSKKKLKQMEFAAEVFIHKNKFDNFEVRLQGAVVEGENFQIKEILEI